MAGNDPLVVSFKDAEGNPGEITTSGVYQQLQQAGYPVTGVSADGMEFHFSDPRGEYTMAIPDIMKNLGHEVNYVEPTAPDTSKINLRYRAAISRLPDDDAKKAYIESKLKREGVENANVIGYGRDWHYFDPSSNIRVAGVGTLVRMSPDDRWLHQVALWMQDEAHHLVRQTRDRRPRRAFFPLVDDPGFLYGLPPEPRPTAD